MFRNEFHIGWNRFICSMAKPKVRYRHNLGFSQILGASSCTPFGVKNGKKDPSCFSSRHIRMLNDKDVFKKQNSADKLRDMDLLIVLMRKGSTHTHRVGIQRTRWRRSHLYFLDKICRDFSVHYGFLIKTSLPSIDSRFPSKSITTNSFCSSSKQCWVMETPFSNANRVFFSF